MCIRDSIRRFSENAEAGDHYTPREVIRLMVNVLLAEGCNDLLTDEGKIATVLDAACGSGGDVYKRQISNRIPAFLFNW